MSAFVALVVCVVHLRPVAEVVAVGVGLERVRAASCSPAAESPSLVEVLGGVARPVAVRVGLRRMVREQGDEDLEAIGEPVAVRVAEPRIRAGAQLEHVGHAVAVSVGAPVVARP